MERKMQKKIEEGEERVYLISLKVEQGFISPCSRQPDIYFFIIQLLL